MYYELPPHHLAILLIQYIVTTNRLDKPTLLMISQQCFLQKTCEKLFILKRCSKEY